MRRPNQVEAATNAVFSVVDGVSKRPGTEFVAVITDMVTGANVRLHPIVNDPDTIYVVTHGIPEAAPAGS